MQNKICFTSIDVEQEIKGLNKILDIFKKYNIPATLFVTGEILEKYNNLVKEWSRVYEIACHSYTHRFWNTLNSEERKKELEDFIILYQKVFTESPKGFRAPSHLIDEEGIRLLEESGFLYDSSVVPHYPPFKKYRGYKGRAPLLPYYPKGRKILEIPVSGQLFGIPLAGAWITKLPFWFYKILFFIHCPEFITLSIHSWDKLKNFERIIRLLKNKNYQFLNGEQIYKNRQ
jgi:peptidoglycan/xylan/chitin deacetylase (PgdA/CDA1 family)